MATVTVNVENYPEDGVTNIEIQELTAFAEVGEAGWVEVLDTDSVGTNPSWTIAYSVTASTAGLVFRYRWTVDGGITAWYTPVSLSITPTANEALRIKGAIISKAIRLLVLPEAPFGSFGETADFGGMQVSVKPDYSIKEQLYGLVGQHLAVSGVSPDTDDVIRNGLNIDPSDFPTYKVEDVTRALGAATDWVDNYLNGSLGLGA